MTEKTYVKSIVGKVHGTKETKEKYRKQLMDSIMEREANGEFLYDIAGQMGDPGMVAKRINAEIPADERRSVVIKKVIFWAVLLVVAAIVIWRVDLYITPQTSEFGSTGLFEEEAVTELAMEAAEAFEHDDVDTLLAISTDKMTDIFTMENIEDARSNISDDIGDFIEYTDVVLFETKQFQVDYAFAEVVVSHENADFMYIMMIDQDMKISSFGLQTVGSSEE